MGVRAIVCCVLSVEGGAEGTRGEREAAFYSGARECVVERTGRYAGHIERVAGDCTEWPLHGTCESFEIESNACVANTFTLILQCLARVIG